MRNALRAELLKVRRSTVVATTTGLIVVLVPTISLWFVTLAEGGGPGALALKADALVVGEGWDAYIGVLGQLMAVTMFVGPGVVVAWVFGREHADRTFPSLFALPVSRRAIANAKFWVLLVWCAALTMVTVGMAGLAGLIAGVGPLDASDVPRGLIRLGVAALLTSTISLTIALIASIGRGYLPAIGGIILLTMAAQIAVLSGTGGWFPYAAPGLYAVAGSEGVPEVTTLQLLLVPATTFLVAWLTSSWWARAEVV